MNRTFWAVALAVSVTATASGGVALYLGGIAADENSLASNFDPALWLIFAFGLFGSIVALPACMATRMSKPGPRRG